jgi:type II secretory pathway predicted ATPase ExeA
MLDKIQSYFGFTRLPFGRDLAPSMLFASTDHNQAAARITYGITTHGITVITGEVGIGKTVAARAAISRLEPARHHLIYIPDPTIGARGIYHHIVTALGGHPHFHTATLGPQTRDALAAEHAERARTPILLIDEAHLLTHDTLEALRLLTNHELDTTSPFATILLGQPTLNTKMKLGTLAALEQRITIRRHMTGMTNQETTEYIHHHLKIAGRTDPLFTDDAITLIHTTSRGKPRTTNRLAISALIATCATNKNLIDETSARSAITEHTDTLTTTTTP